MSKGRRYDNEPKLNMKKVFGLFICIAVIIMIIVSIKNILNGNDDTTIEQGAKTYFTVYSNQKWGVIDNNGNTVIKPQYDEMVVIPNKDKPIFIYAYDINDETGEYKTKAINEKGEELFAGYDKVEAIENYDSKQNIWFENNLLRVSKDGQYGLIDFEGNTVLNCEYDEITALKGVTENLIVKKDGKVGLVNAKGQSIIKVVYNDIKVLEEGSKSEYIIVDETGKMGVISTSGTIILEPKYDEVKYVYSTENYAVKEEDEWKLVNKLAETVLEGYDDFLHVKGDNVIVEDSDKYGLVTLAGEEKIKAEYEEFKYAFSIYYIAKKDGKYGIINVNNETIVPFEYISMDYIAEGGFIIADVSDTETAIFDSNLAKKLTGIFEEINTDKGYIRAYIDENYKYYNFKFEEKSSSDILSNNTIYLSKKDGKFGFVDKAGQVVVDYIYDDATEQNEYGYAAVKKDGLWGAIGKNGAIVCELKVNLDNNIYSNFIGEWHLSDEGIYYVK